MNRVAVTHGTVAVNVPAHLALPPQAGKPSPREANPGDEVYHQTPVPGANRPGPPKTRGDTLNLSPAHHPNTRTPKPSSSPTTCVSGSPITAVKSSPRTRSKSAMPSDSTRYDPAQSSGASLAT